MRRSTLLRDLSQHLRRSAHDLEEAGLGEWATHLIGDAECMERDALSLSLLEPPPPSIASLAGSIPDFTGGLSPEEFLRRLRGGT